MLKVISVLIAITVVLLWLGWPVIVSVWAGTPDNAGQFGDQFGALNTLFTGFAFIGLIVALFMQMKELGLQRDEIRQSRDELRGQKSALLDQAATLRQKQDEDRFFAMLNWFNAYIDDISGVRSGDARRTAISGRDQFDELARSIYERTARSGKKDYDGLISSYHQVYKNEESDLGGYFRILYQILKYLTVRQVEDRKLFAHLLRAQLSKSELILIDLNLRTEKGAGLQQYIDEYEILKHCPDSLNDIPLHKSDSSIRSYVE